MLVVGRGINAIADEFMESTDLRAIRNTAAGAWGSYGASGTTQLNYYGNGTLTPGTSRSFYWDGTSTPSDKNSMIPVMPGQVWSMSMVYSSTAGGPRLSIRVIKRDGSTSYTTTGITAPDGTTNIYEPAGTLKPIERIYTVPADVMYVMPAIQFASACTSAYVGGRGDVHQHGHPVPRGRGRHRREAPHGDRGNVDEDPAFQEAHRRRN